MIESLGRVLDFLVHIDAHLDQLLVVYGSWFYPMLFLVVFCETGLVVTPFLPGDSLLFAAGALASRGHGLDVWWLFLVLSLAAVLGDTVNYWIGSTLGPRLLKSRDSRVLKRAYLDRTRHFFERYGSKTIVLARFVPIVRTFAPFLAGVGEMDYRRFAMFNVVGGIVWVGLFLFAGFFFGNIPFVEDNLIAVLFAVVAITTAPIVVEYLRHRRAERVAAAE